MGDCMVFPDTVEEFMEQYKVVDTDHVYSNGVEFIPIFRMKQWLEHLPTNCISRQAAIDAGLELLEARRKWDTAEGRA